MDDSIKLINNLQYEIDVKRKTLNGDANWYLMTLVDEGQPVNVEQYVRTDFLKIDAIRDCIASGEIKTESHLFYKLQELAMRAVAHRIANERVELECVKPFTDEYLKNHFVKTEFERELVKHGYSLKQYEDELKSLNKASPAKPKM
ncbi:hypothetical protein C7A11_26525 [Pseudomonas simiae]|uniref:hypothetical protein n=1 Tax=Pseudomonas simiae TaxID=321846 RepID=UPI000D029F2B|nr:hypothetical protein [Pseudomonas simiae]PRW84346.1 hypothetical protein C7A11_26525 [Pseudomonas simiae]